MNVPVMAYQFGSPRPHAFADLSLVRTLQPLMTDEGNKVPAGSRGTVVAIYAEGAAYEVEFDAGLATVEAGTLEAA